METKTSKDLQKIRDLEEKIKNVSGDLSKLDVCSLIGISKDYQEFLRLAIKYKFCISTKRVKAVARSYVNIIDEAAKKMEYFGYS